MIVRFDEYELDLDAIELRRDGAPLKADSVVLRLLADLVVHAGQLVTKEQLIARVWEGRAVSENVITVAITRLRKVLGRETAGRDFVVNVHGRGYRFVRPVTRQTERVPAGSPPAPVLRGLPFVGRNAVLVRLRTLLGELGRGRGAACFFIGEPGIGKTSVAEVVEADATAAGFTVAWGYSREAGNTPPLWPIVRLLRDALERTRARGHDSRVERALLEASESLPELAPQAAPEAPTSPRAEPPAHRVFDAILRVLSLLAERTPLVLVLDDLHAADAASLELLRVLVAELARVPLLVLGTLRSGVALEPPAAGHLAYALGHRNSTRIDLGRLTERDVAGYLRGVLGRNDDGLARAVHAKSEGNPFYMVELSRLARDASGEGAAALRLSDAALDIMRQRVTAMDSTMRDVLSTAAVIGNQFDLSLLAAVSGSDGPTLMASIDRAVAQRVVAENSDLKTTFRFGHDLLRGVLYDDLAKSHRRALHLRVVEALEQRLEAGGTVAPAELAFHARAAIPQGDPARLVRYCREAALAGAERRSYGDAVRYVRYAREALELCPSPDPQLRMTLLLQHALFARSCSSPDFAPAVNQALHLAREESDHASFVRAALMLDLHPGFPACSGARAALEEARRLPLPEDLLSAVTARLSTCAPIAYDVDRSSGYLATSRALAEKTGSLLARYTVSSAELFAVGGPASNDRAAAVQAELEAMFQANPRILTVSPVVLDLHRAIVAARAGNAVETTAALDRAVARCNEVGNHELAWHAERFRLLSRVNAGDLKRAAPLLREHHRLGRVESLIGTSPFVAYDERVVLGASFDRTLDDLALAPHPDDSPGIWALKLRALQASGGTEAARRSLHLLRPSALERLPCDRDYLGTLGALTRVALALDELDYLAVLEVLLRPYGDCLAIGVGFFSEGSVSELLDAAVARRTRGVARRFG